jgi:hypothetical protein
MNEKRASLFFITGPFTTRQAEVTSPFDLYSFNSGNSLYNRPNENVSKKITKNHSLIQKQNKDEIYEKLNGKS